MFRALISVFLLFTLLANPASSGDKKGVLLEQKIATLFPANAKWALNVVDMETGTETISIGNSVGGAMKPGSLMKLFISGAVLDYSEGQGKIDMDTTILHDGSVTGDTLKGSLYLTGKGNALLSARDLKSAVEGIQKLGIKKIVGDIVADETFFDTKGFERKRTGPAYAPAGALGLDLHTVSVIVTPAETGKPPLVSIEPLNDSVRFSVSARTVASGSNTIKIAQIDDHSYSVTGSVPAGTWVLKRRFPLNDPSLYAAGSLKTLLKQAGITMDGDAKKGKTPDGAKVIVEMNSTAIDDLVRDMNVNSVNLLADNLLLLLGKERFGVPGTVEKGVRAVEDYLEGFEGSSGRGEASLFDGSGLDERNRVTAGFVTGYLYEASKRPWFGRFKASLPSAGEGTSKEMGFSDLRFRIKTGMLEDAYALAGYGVDGKGKDIAFSYIVNMPGADVLAVKKHGGEVIRLIAGLQ